MAAKKKVTTNKEETGVVIAEQIRSMGMQINLQMPDSPDQAWAMIRREENEAALNMARRGMLYLYLKTQLPHGEFENGLGDLGIAPQRAHDAMQVARMLAKLPSPTLKKLAPVSGSKLIELARIPEEAIDEMAEGGELDDIDKMSVRDLKAHLRAERMKREKADNRYKSLVKVQQKAQALSALDDDEKWEPVTRAIRRDADALTEQAMMAVDSLDQLLSQLSDPLLDLDAANQNAAITTLYHQARAPFAKLSRLLTEMQKIYGDVIAMDDSALPLFSEEEAAQALATRSLLLGEHRAKADARADTKGPVQKKRGPAKKNTAK